ncbi:MAG: IPT/TIG domain-containing protein [Deltaproteobacteria bacterium]|nr:IPT/TIG domain-containing protein [Deltaproteobacteria bacterium]
MYYGSVGFNYKASSYYIWPVRGGQIGASGPVIVSFSPKEGGPGTIVTIKGTNLSGATAVTFGGKAAKSFTVDSSTQITAKVDDGAIGAIRVKTPNGSYLSGPNFYYIDNVQVTPVPPPNIVPDPGGWTAANGKQVYLQKYSDGSAICLISTDGKTIQAFYDPNLVHGVFNGGDVATGGKAQSLYIVFTATDQGQYAVTDLTSGQAKENSKISLSSKAVVNPDTDGVWQAAAGTSQAFYFQRYTGGGAMLLMSTDAVNCQVYYDPAATANSFSGRDIYNLGTSATFSFIGTVSGQVSRTTSDGQKTTWSVTKLSSAK